MEPVDASTLTVSYDGTCGPEKGTKCASGCCSQYGNCGNSPEHCSGACQHAFGVGCTDPDVAGSWQIALKNGVMDKKAGGQYYFDPVNRLFWTWDTPELISRKFDQIVKKYKLGGVMAWSLGEDSYDWSHIRAMSDALSKSGYTSPSVHNSNTMQSAESGPVNPKAPHVAGAPAPSKHASSVNTVFVDGTSDGPKGDHASQPGSPDDYSVPAPQEDASTPQQLKPLRPLSQPKQASAPAPSTDDLPFSPEFLDAMNGSGRGRKARRANMEGSCD
jgi:chitinase